MGMTNTTARRGRLASIQFIPAEPVALYARTSARCWCESTITLRTDGVWWHGAHQGIYCREREQD